MEIITRKEAIEKGQAWFFTGEPCKNGHIAKKGVKRWHCYECAKEVKKVALIKHGDKIRRQARESYRRNFDSIAKKAKEKYPEVKEERKKYLKEYYIKNREHLLNEASIYFNNNKDAVQEYKKVWNKTENGIVNAKRSKANRRSKEKKLGVLKKSELNALLSVTTKCYWCACKIDKNISGSFHFDHYIPIALDGSNTIDNIVVSCPKCNLNKKAKDPHDFAREKGRLL